MSTFIGSPMNRVQLTPWTIFHVFFCRLKEFKIKIQFSVSTYRSNYEFILSCLSCLIFIGFDLWFHLGDLLLLLAFVCSTPETIVSSNPQSENSIFSASIECSENIKFLLFIAVIFTYIHSMVVCASATAINNSRSRQKK